MKLTHADHCSRDIRSRIFRYENNNFTFDMLILKCTLDVHRQLEIYVWTRRVLGIKIYLRVTRIQVTNILSKTSLSIAIIHSKNGPQLESKNPLQGTIWVLGSGKEHIIWKCPLKDLIQAFPFPVDVASSYPI